MNVLFFLILQVQKKGPPEGIVDAFFKQTNFKLNKFY